MQFLVNAVFSCDLNNHMLKKSVSVLKKSVSVSVLKNFSLDSLYCKVCQVGLMFSPSLSI